MNMIARIWKHWKRLGALRDGAIVGGTILYLVGYCTWSLFAYAYGPGAVRALDSQYFMIGLPVVLLVGALTVAILISRRIARAWHGFYRKRAHSTRRWISLVMVGTTLLAFVLALFGNQRGYIKLPWALIAIGYFVAMMTDFPSAVPVQEKFTHLWMSFTLIVLSLFAISFFVLSMYGKIPQALGGGAPRRAQLDVKLDQISSELAAELLTMAPTAESKVGRTHDVWVLSLPGDVLLISPSRDLSQAHDRLELQRSAVVAIRWQD
jgi:hypothetical protein